MTISAQAKMTTAEGVEAASARRLHVSLLIGSGVVAATQVGKAIIAAPMIRHDFALGLDLVGLIVATFATIGASFGICAGALLQRVGLRRALVAGMGLIAFGNLAGSTAPNEFALLAARVVEGAGFFGVVLAIPSVLSRIVAPNERDFVMAAWSAYMPAGIMLMLLLGPLMPDVGWRNLWRASALVAGGCGALLAMYAPAAPEGFPASNARFLGGAADVVRNPRCLVLAFAFFAYSCQIFSLAFALPLLLMSAHGVTLGAAGLLCAAVLAVSAIGTVSSAFMLRAGVPIWAHIATAFGLFSVSGFAIYSGALPPLAVVLVAALALGVGGLAPGALYAAAPHAAPSPAAVPPTIGLLQQASNLGQFAGPAALGLWVEHFGWSAAPAIVTPAALVGLAIALTIRRVMGGRNRD
jgi:MFS transporter, DHA1 family, inner membrane transport protein